MGTWNRSWKLKMNILNALSPRTLAGRPYPDCQTYAKTISARLLELHLNTLEYDSTCQYVKVPFYPCICCMPVIPGNTGTLQTSAWTGMQQ